MLLASLVAVATHLSPVAAPTDTALAANRACVAARTSSPAASISAGPKLSMLFIVSRSDGPGAK